MNRPTMKKKKAAKGNRSDQKADDGTDRIPVSIWARNALATVDVSSLAGNGDISLFESYKSSYGANPNGWPPKIKTKLALSSLGSSEDGETKSSFLMAALKISHFLAGQIHKSEHYFSSAQNGESVEAGSTLPFLPSPGIDWTDRIFVHCNKSPGNGDAQRKSNNGRQDEAESADSRQHSFDDDDFQPLPFDTGKLDYDDDFQLVVNSFIEDASPLTQDDQLAVDSNLLDVARAELFPDYEKDLQARLGEDVNMRIYSLGIVLYEIFSGGSKPPELSSNFENGRGRQEENAYESTQPLDDLYNPIGANDTNSIDFSGALNILEKLEDADDSNNVFENLYNEVEEVQLVKRSKQHWPADRGGSNQGTQNTCQISVEPLKLLGLPTPLCNLISNMLDCANGDLSGDEAYRKMADVCGDLQRMINKPTVFLKEIDVDKLSRSGLQLPRPFFEKDKSFSLLVNSHDRSISGESEFTVISGPSGVGKSVLANRLENIVTSRGGIFLKGKFDQLKQPKPFSAIANAFNEYCSILEREAGLDGTKKVVSKLESTLGDDSLILSKVIPNLCSLLGRSSEAGIEECVDAEKRLQYLLSRFVQAIVTHSDVSLTLFLDDFQWADPASLEVINRIILMTGSSKKMKFFLFGCCRSEEVNQDHPFRKMLTGVRHFDVRVTEIKLRCLDREATNEVISNALCLFPRLTMPLSDIVHHKTKGNPQFMSQLLISLSKEGLLRVSLSRRRWIWDYEKIQSRKMPDDVADFFTSTINKLPSNVQSALQVLACFGSSISFGLVETLERNLKLDMFGPLDDATKEGLLDKTVDGFRFAHDRIQEAAFNEIEPSERCLRHFKYGLALVPDSMGNEVNDSMIFVAVDQINRGGPSVVSGNEQSVLIGNLNFKAGDKSIEMSDFRSALSFFDHGIKFLPKNHWIEHYHLSLQLFKAACSCALSTGDLGRMEFLAEQVLTHAMSLEDQLDILYFTTNALLYASKIPECINKGLAILAKLGEEIPNTLTESDLSFLIEKTDYMLSGLTDRDLVHYRAMVDKKYLMAMKFLTTLTGLMDMVMPDVQPVITFRMVHLSIDHGMSPLSPIAFAYFGSFQAKLGNIRRGYYYVKIAMDLLNTTGSKQSAGQVILLASQVFSFVDPLQTIADMHLNGINTAMAAGDMNFAMVHSIFYVAMYYQSGNNLNDAQEQCEVALRRMDEHNHLMWKSHLLPLQRTMLSLVGSDASGKDISQCDDIVNDSPLELALVEQNVQVAINFYFQKMSSAYAFRRYDEMVEFAEKFVQCYRTFNAMVFENAHKPFITGLVSFWIYRKSNDSSWAERGSQAKEDMKKFAESSKWNFNQKYQLLEAEEHFSFKNLDLAKASYDIAIASAREHKFINDEALTCDLAGHFFLDSGNIQSAAACFNQAHERYSTWGAFAKAKQVADFTKTHIEPLLSETSSSPTPYMMFESSQNGHRKRLQTESVQIA